MGATPEELSEEEPPPQPEEGGEAPLGEGAHANGSAPEEAEEVDAGTDTTSGPDGATCNGVGLLRWFKALAKIARGLHDGCRVDHHPLRDGCCKTLPCVRVKTETLATPWRF